VNDTLKSSSAGENPWKLALEGSGVGVWDWDIATGEQTHSPHWEEMLGFRAGELKKGYEVFEALVHPDDLAMVQTAARTYMEGRAPEYSVDFRMRCKDGSWKWILTRGMVVERDARGVPLRMIGTHTDISERKRAEDELRALNAQLLENAQLLQTTLTSISQGILLIDADEKVRKFNPRVCELLDLPERLLATRPSMQEVTRYQMERGDFGPDAQLVDTAARRYVMGVADGATDLLPNQYLRVTPAGRTLEVRTQALPNGGMVRTFADVTNYVQAEAARQRLNQLLNATQTIARVGGWERDFVSGAVSWTEGVYRILELSPQEFTPGDLISTQRFFTPEAQEMIKAVAPAQAATTLTSHDMELQMITARGRTIWIRFMGTTTWDQGRPLKRTSVLQDITERKLADTALRRSERMFSTAFSSCPVAASIADLETGCFMEVNTNFERDFGWTKEELIGRTSMEVGLWPDAVARVPWAQKIQSAGRLVDYESVWVHKNGQLRNVSISGEITELDGKACVLAYATDITSRKTAEALIRQQAFYDALTGLPNRRMLRDRLEQDIKKSRRDDHQLALLFIDLDHFKEVNDTLGHDRGDLLLIEAGRRIQDCVRDSDTVARMGGDEFTVILAELPNNHHIEGILQKILHALEAVFQLGTEQVFVSASIGITMYPADATEIEDLFKHADQALYVAKGAGRNRFGFFTPALQEAAQTRVRLANDLRTALVENQFRVVYQPIVELATGAIHKAEALIRWHHPTRGLVSPAAFIPIAESSGLIVDIGEWVFQQAARQVQAWRLDLAPNFQISVNKSPVQFHHDGSGKAAWALQLEAQGLPGECIVVEITEGLLLDTSDSVASTLLALRDAGIQVSLDDFGTGYSSLSYLQKFDIDFLKIDQSFVRHLIADSTDLALCKAITVMAHALGIKVIAEGVETAQQRDLLAAVDCDYVQGFLYARPMSAPDFEAFMADYTPSAPRQTPDSGR